MADQSHAEPMLERKLATILSADVAEYSRLMAEDEEGTLRTFRAHSQIFESLVALHRGRIFNTAGDAILVEFASVVEAVRCATEIQAALRTRNEQLPPAAQVQFRIGVNLGDVMVQNADLLGDGVNVAARLQAAAEPGGICVSGSVYDQIRNKLSLTFASLGERSFKNIPQPIRTFSITGTDDHGALPSPQASRSAGLPGLAKWAAAAVLSLAVAGGYVAYSSYQRGGAEPARTATEPARRDPAVRAPQQASVQPAAPVVAGASLDGLYAGPICYGEAPNDQARCFRAQANVSQGKISGQWATGNAGVTMFLSGEVSADGDTKIEMHSQNAEGRRLVTINLAGKIQDGRLDATGSFLNGRSATLNWRRN